MQNKFQIIILFISIIFVAGVLGITWFIYNLTLKKHLAVETIHADWKVEEDRRADIKQIERILGDIEEERTELDSHFARSLDVVPLLDSLEQTGAAAGALAEVASVDRLEEGKVLVVGMKATGSWSALYKFILLVESSPYELEFTTLDIKRAFTEGGESMWEGFFKIKVISFLP